MFTQEVSIPVDEIIWRNWQKIAKIADFVNFAKIANVHPTAVNTNGWLNLFDEIGKRSPKSLILLILSIVELFRQICHFCHRVHFWT